MKKLVLSFFLLAAPLAFAPTFPALGSEVCIICQHETGCPWTSAGCGTWVPCGADLDAKVEELCSVVENGRTRMGRHTPRRVLHEPTESPGSKCGAAAWTVTCLEH
jgi:hypothetical protein